MSEDDLKHSIDRLEAAVCAHMTKSDVQQLKLLDDEIGKPAAGALGLLVSSLVTKVGERRARRRLGAILKLANRIALVSLL